MSAKMPFFYPRLDSQTIHQTIKLVKSNPGYLDAGECPYTEEIKELFRLLIAPPPEPIVIETKPQIQEDLEIIDVVNMTDDDLMTEINKLYSQLKKSGEGIGTANDTTDSTVRNTYFRLMTSLLEKVSTMRTETTNRMNVTKFTEAVLSTMDDILDADQRNMFLERIKKLEN